MIRYIAVNPDKEVIKVESLNEFSKQFNIPRPKISQVVNKKLKHYKGYHIFRVDEENLDEKINSLTTFELFAVNYFGKDLGPITNLSAYCAEMKLKYGSVLNAIKTGKHYYGRRFFFEAGTDQEYVTMIMEEHKEKMRNRFDRNEDRLNDLFDGGMLEPYEPDSKYNLLGGNINKKLHQKYILEEFKKFDDEDDIAF